MITKEEALKKIESLVKRFDEQKEFYKKTEYNEQIDRIVYELYGLTEEEIKVIEK